MSKQEQAIQILCECDPTYRPDHRFRWCGRERDGAYRIRNEASQAERKAAKALVDGSLRGMVEAVYALDGESGHTIGTYSHLGATTADRDDYAKAYAAGNRGAAVKESAERRHTVRELEALEELVAPRSRFHQLRRRLVVKIRARTPELARIWGSSSPDPDNPCVYVARELVTLYRAWDALRSHPEYPETERYRESLSRYGIRVPYCQSAGKVP